MALGDELKILDDKIEVNQVQYDLEREAAKISALSSKELDRYKYLTRKDLALKPEPIEIKRAEYSPFAQIIIKVVKKHDKGNKGFRYDNDLMYNSVHNFNKYSLSNFNEMSSLDSKFDP